MKTVNRICIKDYDKIDVLRHHVKLESGKAYLTYEEKDGMVTVFTDYVFEVPVEYFLRGDK